MSILEELQRSIAGMKYILLLCACALLGCVDANSFELAAGEPADRDALTEGCERFEIVEWRAELAYGPNILPVPFDVALEGPVPPSAQSVFAAADHVLAAEAVVVAGEGDLGFIEEMGVAIGGQYIAQGVNLHGERGALSVDLSPIKVDGEVRVDVYGRNPERDTALTLHLTFEAFGQCQAGIKFK